MQTVPLTGSSSKSLTRGWGWPAAGGQGKGGEREEGSSQALGTLPVREFRALGL